MIAVAEENSDTKIFCCASCGIAAVDDVVKLKDCDGCDMLRYCSKKCQEDHRPEHEEECKQRAAELHDEILFKQPESTHLGDCPICCLPLSIDDQKSVLTTCCGKELCVGCVYANLEREAKGKLQHKCPFCRTAVPVPGTKEEINKQLMNRIEANDPAAIRAMGTERHKEGDYSSAFEYWIRAAALGDSEAHHQLSILYHNGEVVEKDEKKEMHHLEHAAIGGHPLARHHLGYFEVRNELYDRAGKHWIIAAKLGNDDSLKCVKNLYVAGIVTKKDFAGALRGHHAAIAATTSHQREVAAIFFEKK